MKTKKLYALTEDLKDNLKWINLLRMYIEKAEFVEFNNLYDPEILDPELEALKPDLVKEAERKDKIFASGKYQRYNLSERVKDFILSKPYESWYNYQLEDLSLIKDGIELLATITHENYIFVLLNEKERVELNKMGYNFGGLFEI